MAKSRIGPFALEAPLSPPKASGQMFRGIHLEQRKLAALRVFTVPMGMTPESRQAFASQLEQLKQLRQRGIARCYGGGFDTRYAYLAYELVDGESLETMLARRERLPWETALDFSQQLAEALQYAHQMGWIHGRLKPDKILIQADGTAKISDWRRGAMTSVIGTSTAEIDSVQFSAPEVLDGSQADEKSDLYSVGCLMFTMLTGHPPFRGDASTLPDLIRSEPAPNASAEVMDCPVWLSAIVEQLLSKDAKQRPFSATALQLAFKEAQRRQAEGASVLQHATSGFSPLQMKVDREEAEKVLGIKPKKKRRKRDPEASFFDQAWVLLVGLIFAIGAVVWFLLPLGEETLRARADGLLPPESEEWIDWNQARDSYLIPLVQRFPESPHQEWASEQIDWVDAREYERRLIRENGRNRKDNWSDADRQYWRAWEFEEFGDLMSAMDRYRAVIGLYRKQEEAASIVYLANEGLQRIRSKGLSKSSLQEFVSKQLNEANAAYDKGRILDARQKWEWIVSLYSGNQEVSAQVAEAEQMIASVKSSN